MSWRREPGEPFWSQRRTAADLERVVAIGQRVMVEGVTVALAALDLYGDLGCELRYALHFTSPESSPTQPEMDLTVRDAHGRFYEVYRGESSFGGEGEYEVSGTLILEPLGEEAGELVVAISRLVWEELAHSHGGIRLEEPIVTRNVEGPWIFRFQVS